MGKRSLAQRLASKLSWENLVGYKPLILLLCALRLPKGRFQVFPPDTVEPHIVPRMAGNPDRRRPRGHYYTTAVTEKRLLVQGYAQPFDLILCSLIRR